MNIAVFGGTFDPFHNGHRHIAEYILNKHLAECILFVPAAIPPHKNDKLISPYPIRRKLLELGTQGMSGIRISDIEQEREEKSYTIDTLAELKLQTPDDNFLLIIGGDSLASLHLWHRAHELVQNYPILTYPRPGCDITEKSLPKFWNINEKRKLLASLMPDAPVMDVSSTQLRRLFASGKIPDSSLVPEEESKWIIQQKLYTKD